MLSNSHSTANASFTDNAATTITTKGAMESVVFSVKGLDVHQIKDVLIGCNSDICRLGYKHNSTAFEYSTDSALIKYEADRLA